MLLVCNLRRQKMDDGHQHTQKCEVLGVSDVVKLVGKRPVKAIDAYMQQADCLVSPRLEGVNTPMKVFTYLASGVPVLATELDTHTQVMNHDMGILVAPELEVFANAIGDIARAPEEFTKRADKAKRVMDEQYSYPSFCRKVESIYRYLECLS